MAVSKKKLKAKRKAEKQMGPKAKARVKLSKQIEAREKVKASKRQASEIEAKRKPKAREDDDVDDLFARMGEFADGDEDADDGESGSEASSDGGFVDVDGGGMDIDDEDLEGLDDEDAAARHESELKEIKKRDPEFYKFLVEQDRSLLDFRAEQVQGQGPEDDDEDEQEEDFAAVPSDATASGQVATRILTLERFKHLQACAKDSFTSCKAVLNAYHQAVRSIGADSQLGEEGQEAMKEEESKEQQQGKGAVPKKKEKVEKRRSAAALKRQQKNMLQIDSEATFSEVLEWSIGNMLSLLRHHGGEPGKADKKRKKKFEPGLADRPEGVFDPSQLERWNRVKVLSHVFWQETLFLLNHLASSEMLEFVLRRVSTPEALSWLWPFKHLQKSYAKRCLSLWAKGESQQVKVLAFLFIRNSGSMALHAPGAKEGDTNQLELLMRGVVKSFAEVTSWGYSWRSLSTFRFMENCMVELFRLEDATAYRVGYVCIRQLALILRNSCLAASQAGESKGKDAKKEKDKKQEKQSKGKGKGKGKDEWGGQSQSSKRRASQIKQANSLVAWPFVRSIYLWTKAIGSLQSLRPLAYPLSMITLGALKCKLTSLQHFPFSFHLLCCLNRLGASLEAFVPVSSHLLKVLSVLLQAMEKGHKKVRGGARPDGEQLANAKTPEIEVLLRLPQSLVSEALVLESIGNAICALLTDHLGLISRSPAFPEVSAPVLLHLRRHSKHCRSEAMRRQLRNIISAAESSAALVQQRREALTEPPSAVKFLFLGPDETVLGKQRAQLVQRRAAEEKTRVEAEMREASSGGARRRRGQEVEEQEAGEAAPGTGMSKKALKRRKLRAAKERSLEGEGDGTSAPKAPVPGQPRADAALVAKRAGAKLHEDKVEEMNFDSGDE